MSRTAKVLDAMEDGYYTTTFLAQQTGLSPAEIDSVLSELLAEGLILILHGNNTRIVAKRPTIGQG
jgi:predicted Rossmann fold nucleotide-binding protein DprA/Smf involved in DNA uptake